MNDLKPDWKRVCPLREIPRLGARVVRSAAGDIAVFRTADDAVHALLDRCPHRGGPLSQGIVHGDAVTCPLHGQRIELSTGAVAPPDTGCAARFDAKLEDGHVYLRVPPRTPA